MKYLTGMDHIVYPKNTSLAPLKIPYLCQQRPKYDGLGFISFPERQPWANGSIKSPRVQQLYREKSASVLREAVRLSEVLETAAYKSVWRTCTCVMLYSGPSPDTWGDTVPRTDPPIHKKHFVMSPAEN